VLPSLSIKMSAEKRPLLPRPKPSERFFYHTDRESHRVDALLLQRENIYEEIDDYRLVSDSPAFASAHSDAWNQRRASESDQEAGIVYTVVWHPTLAQAESVKTVNVGTQTRCIIDYLKLQHNPQYVFSHISRWHLQ